MYEFHSNQLCVHVNFVSIFFSFCFIAAALSVHQHGTIEFQNMQLRVRRLPHPSSSQTKPKDEQNTCAIKVSNLPENATEEQLKLFFESTRHSGGGNTKRILLQSDNQTAIVVFHNPEGNIV